MTTKLVKIGSKLKKQGDLENVKNGSGTGDISYENLISGGLLGRLDIS